MEMIFPYAYNSKRLDWWRNVRFIVWGSSSKLLVEDVELQVLIGKMKEEGVILLACKACANNLGVSAKLEELGIEVVYMGKPLTDMLKGDWTVLTF